VQPLAAGATVLAAVGDAKHPARVVVTIAAACAFGAVLTRGRQAVPADWFTVQVLLAGNLVVFGISNAHQLGVGLAASVALAGVLLLVAASGCIGVGPVSAGETAELTRPTTIACRAVPDRHACAFGSLTAEEIGSDRFSRAGRFAYGLGALERERLGPDG
jgi:hypothetical protein